MRESLRVRQRGRRLLFGAAARREPNGHDDVGGAMGLHQRPSRRRRTAWRPDRGSLARTVHDQGGVLACNGQHTCGVRVRSLRRAPASPVVAGSVPVGQRPSSRVHWLRMCEGRREAAPFEGHWGARRGEYRVRYTIDEDAKVIHVLDVDHRTAGSARALLGAPLPCHRAEVSVRGAAAQLRELT